MHGKVQENHNPIPNTYALGGSLNKLSIISHGLCHRTYCVIVLGDLANHIQRESNCLLDCPDRFLRISDYPVGPLRER